MSIHIPVETDTHITIAVLLEAEFLIVRVKEFPLMSPLPSNDYV
jgi:hypothetical protein